MCRSFFTPIRERDSFPLPSVDVEPAPRPGLSRGTRQRIQRRRMIGYRTNQAIKSLNELYQPSCSSSPNCSSSSNQASMELHSLFADFDPAHDIGAQEAVRSLLGSEVAYSGELSQHMTLAPYDRSKLALPGIRTPANSLVDLLDSEASKTIVGFKTELLLDEHSYNSRIQEEGKAVPYLDPRLRNIKEYQLFISELYSQHIIGFIDTCHSMCGAFAVVKKMENFDLLSTLELLIKCSKNVPRCPWGGHPLGVLFQHRIPAICTTPSMM